MAPAGERLAPKKVFGLAIEKALGIEAFPAHFSAGSSQTCFEIILDAGFAIVAKREQGAAPDNSLVAPTTEQAEQGGGAGEGRPLWWAGRERAYDDRRVG